MAAGAIGPIAVFVATRRRTLESAITVVYGIWLGIYLWTFVPTKY